jgi:ABC-type glutathione transport system ATPase component
VALSDINFTVKRGELLAVVGVVGSGKVVFFLFSPLLFAFSGSSPTPSSIPFVTAGLRETKKTEKVNDGTCQEYKI